MNDSRTKMIKYLEEKISNQKDKFKAQLDRTILDMFKEGHIDAKFSLNPQEDDRVIISITEKGERLYLLSLADKAPSVGEA